MTATIPTGNPSLQLTVSDTADGINGSMTFQLFQDLTPNTVEQIMNLVNDGFYNNLTFHRVISGFMIQGGDPNGDGTGGPGYNFDDEFNAALQFTSPGMLAMANSGPDTNGSQFFVTVEPYRAGDFRYTIFGLLTSGSDHSQRDRRGAGGLERQAAQHRDDHQRHALHRHAERGVAALRADRHDGHGRRDRHRQRHRHQRNPNSASRST